MIYDIKAKLKTTLKRKKDEKETPHIPALSLKWTLSRIRFRRGSSYRERCVAWFARVGASSGAHSRR